MLRQMDAVGGFIPSVFTYCERSRSVHYGDHYWRVHVAQRGSAISAVVPERSTFVSIIASQDVAASRHDGVFGESELAEGCSSWAMESVAVRVVAKRYLAKQFHCSTRDIVLSAPNKYSEPRGSILGRPFDHGLSFSHDGRFVAVAISEYLLR